MAIKLHSPMGQIPELKIVDEKIKADEFDYVAVGRALLADSEWAVKLKNGNLNQVLHYTKESERYLN
ncbi:hypothetical protein [Bacillus sp. FJAT-29814]|uniref:hypothetical protein n=1 Tax=Bacillus sp. FJAT-29814 TaxID=1729688 RepID=UPI00082D4F09|nr:hypothetical protein [Bacillus sp. FJAT-29814]